MRKIGVCIAGGGGAGVFQVGMLEALDASVKIESVSGASVGSLNGALYVQGDLKELRKLWLKIKRRDLFTYSKIFVPLSSSYSNPSGLYNLIDKYVDERKLAISKKNLYIQATNNINYEPKIFKKNYKDIKLALRASSAIPILFPEVKVDNEFYVDGGIADNTPTLPLIADGCTHIFVLHAHPKSDPIRRTKILRRSRAITKTINAMFHSGQKKDLELIKQINYYVENGWGAPHQRYIHLINIFPLTEVDTLEFDPHKAKERMDEGYILAKQAVLPFMEEG